MFLLCLVFCFVLFFGMRIYIHIHVCVCVSPPAATAQASILKAQIRKLRLKNFRFERLKLVMFEIADSCPAKLQATFSPEDIAATLVQESRVS